MKFSTSPMKAVTKPAFDVNAAIESLTESLEQVGQSYDAVVAAEGRMIEAEQVLNDCHTALESLKKFGVSVENMALLNEDNALDQALGMENLALESIASLSAATKSALQSQYVAGLEANASEVVKAMAEKVKEFFAKVWQWLKDFFTGNAKIVKIVQETILKDKISELDSEKKITAFSKEDTDKAIGKLDETINWLKNADAVTATSSKTMSLDLMADMSMEKKTDTVDKLGWNAATLKATAEKFNALATKTDVSKTWNDINVKYKKLAADDSKFEELKTSFTHWVTARKYTNLYGKLVRQIGLTLVTVAKAAKKAAPAPAAK